MDKPKLLVDMTQEKVMAYWVHRRPVNTHPFPQSIWVVTVVGKYYYDNDLYYTVLTPPGSLEAVYHSDLFFDVEKAKDELRRDLAYLQTKIDKYYAYLEHWPNHPPDMAADEEWNYTQSHMTDYF